MILEMKPLLEDPVTRATPLVARLASSDIPPPYYIGHINRVSLEQQRQLDDAHLLDRSHGGITCS
jgi:hypothetical protein